MTDYERHQKEAMELLCDILIRGHIDMPRIIKWIAYHKALDAGGGGC